jgi:uncharacterized membrane protein YjgN (DUF898 family)
MNIEFVDSDESNDPIPSIQAPVSPVPTPPRRYPLSFTGTGSEYFKIWIVNLLLILITAGIYYPWAKVRKAKYLHRNMMLDGAAFDYQAEGGVILKGTIIAGVLYGAYHLVENSGSGLGFGLFVAAMCVLLPWLLWKSLRFKLSVTTYRALPFSFKGSLKDSYFIFVPIVLYNAAILAIFFLFKPENASQDKQAQMAILKNLGIALGTVGFLILLLTPLFHYLLKRYQHNHYQWTSLRTTLQLSLWQTYKQWIMLSMPFIIIYGTLAIVVFAFESKFKMIAMALVAFVGLVALVFTMFLPVLYKALFTARFQNLIWNSTRAQGVQFVSELKATSLAWLYITNLFLIAITFGLYWPFALVKVVKLRASSISVVCAAPLMHLAAQHAAADKERNAVGDAAGDLFDIDIAL